MSCAVCGTVIVPGARFCYQCGTPQGASNVEDAERRRVTVLFGDLSDFTSWAEDLDPERVGVVTDRVFAALAHVVTDVGGHVDKLTGDGIMAVFGAPVAHEDDAERALRAAATMQEQVAQLVADESGGGRRLGLRVGLNTGVVLAGVQGQLSYTVVGDTVNTASRLSDAAGVGSVYAGRETAQETSRIASWRKLDPLRLKGKRQLVEAYEFVALRPSGNSRPGFGDEAPFIGREAELGALVGRLRAVIDTRQPALLLVAGDVGIGKSRIAEELARISQENYGARVLWGYCSPYGQDRDLEPIAQVVRTVCGIGSRESAEVARERVAWTVSRLSQYDRSGWPPGLLEERLCGLLDIREQRAEGKREWPRDGSPPLPRVNPDDLEAMSVLFSALNSQGPVVLIFEDVHYARPPLLAALQKFGRSVTGSILVIGISRTYDIETQAFHDREDGEVISIGPLDSLTMDRVLRAYLDGTVLPEPERTELIQRGEGNPFFLAELLELLRDRGLLVDSPYGTWTLTGSMPSDALPVGVQSVLAARIDSLDPAGRALLRDASVIGTSFAAASLPYLDPRIDPSTVDQLLEGVAAHGLVISRGEGRWRFAHALARDVAYEGLTKMERARRHAAAASLVARNGRGSEELDSIVAAQAEQAASLATEMALPAADPAWSSGRLGVEAGLRLGRSALRKEDNVAAERILAPALHLARLPQVKKTISREQALDGEVMYAAALSGQRRTAEAERELDGPLGSEFPAIRAAALVILGEVRSRDGDREGARNAFVRAFALAGGAGQDELTGISMRRLGLLDLLDGHLVSAESRFLEALGLARQVRDDWGEAWALQHLTWSWTARGEFTSALRALSSAREHFRTLQDVGGLAWCDGTEALICLLQGRLYDARALIEGVLPLVEGMGARWEAAVCRCIDAMAALRMGELASASVELDLAAVTFNELDDVWGKVLVSLGAGSVDALRGASTEAAAEFEEAERVAAEQQHRPLEMTAIFALGMLCVDTGDLAGAEAAANRMSSRRDQNDAGLDPLAGLWGLRSLISMARGELDDAYDFMLRALSEEGASFLFARQRVLAWLATIELERGHLAEASEFAARAIAELTEDVGSRILALRAHAKVLIAQGRPDEAAGSARDALEIAINAGQEAEIGATRELLAGLDSPEAADAG